MNDDAARSRSVFLKEGAQIITFLVRKMLFPEKRIAEGQTRRNAVFLGECGNGLGLRIAKSDAATTPQAIAGRTVNGADFTPLVKVFPMLAEQRQERLVKVVKFEQSGKVVVNAHWVKYTYLYFAHLPYFNYITIISELRNPNSELSMRTLVLSDIHGSAFACKMALSYLDKLKCDRIFLLGDLLYHGPRNPLPGGHDPQGVVDLLSPLKDKITAVRGNCDAEVDQMVLGFPCLADFAEIEENERQERIRLSEEAEQKKAEADAKEAKRKANRKPWKEWEIKILAENYLKNGNTFIEADKKAIKERGWKPQELLNVKEYMQYFYPYSSVLTEISKKAPKENDFK